MLKNIRLHIERDEERQAQLEEQLAAHIAKTSHESINAFQRNIPSLLKYINQPSQNISLFCNKYGEYNLVDYGTGRTFYGFHPEAEITAHLDAFRTHALSIDFESADKEQHVQLREVTRLGELPACKKLLAADPLSDYPEVLVVLGLGLGAHLHRLVAEHNIKHLIVYEPEPQYFKCSTMASDWKATLELAKQKGTAIYLQIEKDGRDIVADLTELRQHVPVSKAYIYQHYNHPVFNSIASQLQQSNWSELTEKGLRFHFLESSDEYCPPWTAPVTPELWSDLSHGDALYQANLDAFARYFPAIHKEFQHYKPVLWLPIRNAEGQINLIDKKRLIPWYGNSPKFEGDANFQGFAEFPHKDGLVLGYSGTKLKHYLHYQFVAKTEEILKELEEEQGSLPETIKSVIMFGLGCGYQLESMMTTHQVEKIFLCEPNRDFFYASLFAIDWANLLQQIDASEGRIYINIGDDGSHLFRDLLNQFYAVGPYILNSTYFYQAYYNSALNQAIAQLREQLQVVISMGEYFDHAYYGIAQTKEALRRGYPFLKRLPAKYLSQNNRNLPVFLVGNGPSLDFSLTAIKEWQDKAVIVSCGTALQVLHRNGIVPDFHAEIEQNRSTFDWACRIDDFDYLKQITLLSCNGVHPDTCNLYKDVYLAFKEGESSTVSSLQVLGEENYQVLKYAFPTVTNFAVDFFTTLGMKQIYLLGVDLGFVDKKHHHSKQSGYYKEEGDELYDYAQKNNLTLVVPGNFRSTVNTKHEFKVSKIVMEQTLGGRHVECYNCSDGAKIFGASALKIADILITTTVKDKSEFVATVAERAFTIADEQVFCSDFSEKFVHESLLNEMKVFLNLSAEGVETYEEAEVLIEKQKKLLFLSYQHGKSLLFYFLYGTVNYANSVLAKVLYSSSDKVGKISEFNQILSWWRIFLEKFQEKVELKSMLFDVSTTFAYNRYDSNIRQITKDLPLRILTNSRKFYRAAETLNKSKRLGLDIRFSRLSGKVSEPGAVSFEESLTIIYLNPKLADSLSLSDLYHLPTTSHFVVYFNEILEKVSVERIPSNVTLIYLPGDINDPEGLMLAHEVKRFYIFCGYVNKLNDFRLIIPKVKVTDIKQLDTLCPETDVGNYNLYDFRDSVCFSLRELDVEEMLVCSGNRGDYVGKQLKPELLLLRMEDREKVAELKRKIYKTHPFIGEEDSFYV